MRDGNPIEIGDAWTLRKGEKVARCILVTHPFGWELRLMTSDLLRSQVCRSSEEIFDTHEAWKTAMVEKGWRWPRQMRPALLSPITSCGHWSLRNRLAPGTIPRRLGGEPRCRCVRGQLGRQMMSARSPRVRPPRLDPLEPLKASDTRLVSGTCMFSWNRIPSCVAASFGDEDRTRSFGCGRLTSSNPLSRSSSCRLSAFFYSSRALREKTGSAQCRTQA